MQAQSSNVYFVLKQWRLQRPCRLLLLPKIKLTLDRGPFFSQMLDSGFKNKRRIVLESTPDPWPPLLGSEAVMLARPLHVSKVGQWEEKGKTKQATPLSDFFAHGCTWKKELSLVDSSSAELHRWRHNPSRGSRINPTLKVWEHNRVAHASMAPANGHLLEELGWIPWVAWKKQQKEEIHKAHYQWLNADCSIFIHKCTGIFARRIKWSKT